MTIHQPTLSRLQLFRDIDLDSISEFISHFRTMHLQKGDVVLSPLQANDQIYLVVSGLLLVHLDSPENEPIDIIEPGECVGEISALDNLHPSAYVIASQQSHLFVIHSDILWDLINHCNGIARNLLYIYSQRIRYGHELISSSREKERVHAIHANVDALTGLHNRRWLNDVFSREIKRCETDRTMLCLVMIDIDNFKLFNDQHGHLTGDKLLTVVAEAMRTLIRPNDLIARFGGEEFSLLFLETELDDAIILAERIRVGVQKTTLQNHQTREPLSVTISLGVAQRNQGEQLESLLARADAALYQAKQKGRNQVYSEQQ